MINSYPPSYWNIYKSASIFSVSLLKDLARDAMKQPALARIRALSDQFGPCSIEDVRNEHEYFRRISVYDGRGKSFEKAIQDLLDFYKTLESRNNMTEVQ